MSLDGHDKLCGFQNSMFPLCIYGAQDTFSSRIQFLRIWTSNSNPHIIGRFYFDYLFESRGNLTSLTHGYYLDNDFRALEDKILFYSKLMDISQNGDYRMLYFLVLPDRIRVDRGTETGIMATIHSYLRAQCGDMEDSTDCVLYGPSTQNKIERWWKDLLERMERFFKSQLSTLVEDGDYDASDDNDRYTSCTGMVP